MQESIEYLRKQYSNISVLYSIFGEMRLITAKNKLGGKAINF